MVRAKFTLDSYETQLMGPLNAQEEFRTLKFRAVTHGSAENEKFFKYTPSGDIRVGVLNKSAWEQFELGKEYYVDFTPAVPLLQQG